MKYLSLIALVLLALVSCTDQEMAKNYGGTMTMDLEPCRKLVTMTWKESELWVLTRAMRSDETPENYSFHEDSNFDVWEGTVLVVEHECYAEDNAP